MNKKSSSMSSLKKLFKRSSSASSNSEVPTPLEVPSSPDATPRSMPSSPFGGIQSSDLNHSSRRVLTTYGKCEGRLEDMFYLQEEIGKGAFGTVYRSIDKSNGAVCCTKCVAKAGLTEEQLVQHRQEADILLKLNGHKNVVGAVAVFEDERHLHIVMEYCNGGDVLTWLSRHSKPITERMAADIIRVALTVVDHCHTNGVLYRDVKPDNFLVSGSGSKAVIKATDFGVSCYMTEGELCDQMSGTKAYMAPEVYDEMYTFPADVWAVGVMMFLILSGEFPFTGKNDIEMANRVYLARYDTTSKEWSKISAPAKDLLSKLLVRSTEQRLTAKEALKHKWLQKGGALDEPLDPEVQQRIRQYTLANCPQRLALKESTMVLDLDASPWIQKLLDLFVGDLTGNMTLIAAVGELRASEDEYTLQQIQHFVEEQRGVHDGSAGCPSWDNIETSLQEFLTNVVQTEISKAQAVILETCSKMDANESGFVPTETMTMALSKATLSYHQQMRITMLLESAECKNEAGELEYSKFIQGIFERMLPPMASSRFLPNQVSRGTAVGKRRSVLESEGSCLVQ